MKILAQHKFMKNKKAFTVYFVTPKEQKKKGLPSCDHILLSFDDKKKKDILSIGLRPDEVVLLAKLLMCALYNSAKSYTVTNGLKNYKH